MAEEAVPVAAPAPKPRKKPSVSFGSLLDIEGNGKPWTVSEMDGDTATVTRRIGNVMEERRLSAAELEQAIARPLPKNLKAKASPFALRGLSLNKTLDIPDELGGFARITGVDSVSGDVRVDVPGRGATWVPKSAVQDMVLAEGDREKGLSGFKEALGITEEAKPKPKKKEKPVEAVEEAPVAAPVIAPAPVVAIPDSGVEVSAKPAQEEIEETRTVQTRAVPAATPTPPSVVVSKTVRVGGETAAASSSSVRVSKTVSVGTPQPTSTKVSGTVSASVSAQPSIRETRAQLKTDIQAQASIQAPARTAAGATISGSVAVPGAAVALPSAVSASVAAYSTPRSAAMQALELTVKAAVGAFRAAPVANADRAVEQTAMLSRATGALSALESRVAERRASISELQSQADALRQEIGTLNQMRAAGPAAAAGSFRTATSPTNIERSIQEKSQQLGKLQNQLAAGRYSLQKDDGQAQQLKIAVNLMQRVAPEAAEGRVPQAVIDLVSASIPQDLPLLKPTVATAPPTATTAPRSTAPTPAAPAPRSYAPGVAPISRPAPAPNQSGGGGQIAQGMRTRLINGGMGSQMASAVALQGGQDADRRANYTEGLGSDDAYQTGVGGGGETGEPVLSSNVQTYTDVDEAEFEAGQDIFGSEGARQQEFMRAQQQSKFAQEQFLPGTTPNLRTELGAREKVRQQQARPAAQGQTGDLDRARNVSADTQRLRAQGQRAQEEKASQEEEALAAAAGGSSKTEQLTRLRSWLMDLIGLATSVKLVGIIELLINMNGRVLAAKFKKGSLTRKIFPAAMFPFEFWGILSIDIILIIMLFVMFCVIMLPFVIFFVVADGDGGTIIQILSL